MRVLLQGRRDCAAQRDSVWGVYASALVASRPCGLFVGEQAGRDLGPQSGLASGEVRSALRAVAPELPSRSMEHPGCAPNSRPVRWSIQHAFPNSRPVRWSIQHAPRTLGPFFGSSAAGVAAIMFACAVNRGHNRRRKCGEWGSWLVLVVNPLGWRTSWLEKLSCGSFMKARNGRSLSGGARTSSGFWREFGTGRACCWAGCSRWASTLARRRRS